MDGLAGDARRRRLGSGARASGSAQACVGLRIKLLKLLLLGFFQGRLTAEQDADRAGLGCTIGEREKPGVDALKRQEGRNAARGRGEKPE